MADFDRNNLIVMSRPAGQLSAQFFRWKLGFMLDE